MKVDLRQWNNGIQVFPSNADVAMSFRAWVPRWLRWLVTHYLCTWSASWNVYGQTTSKWSNDEEAD